jgi:MerR family transcriptional regulator/heat shock protein HspR
VEEFEGLYIISVAARLLSMHPQTLRKYERAGFIAPSRTVGMLRLYSAQDIERLRLIKHLVDDLGLNLAGVELVLDLTEGLRHLRNLALGADGREVRRRVADEVDAILERVSGSD